MGYTNKPVYEIDKIKLYNLVKEISKIKPEKPAENYKPYHAPSYSSLAEVEDYRFVVDILNLLKDAKSKVALDVKHDKHLKRNMALFSLGYLTASRVTELINIKLSDITVYKNEYSKWFVRVKLINLKNKKAPKKNVIFPYDFNKTEFKIFKYVLKYWIIYMKPFCHKYNISWKDVITKSDKIPLDIKDKLELYTKSRYMFCPIKKGKDSIYHFINNKPLARDTVHRYFDKYVGHNSHFFRKVRATHLYNIYGFKLKQLQKFLGHSDIRSSTPYTFIDTGGMESNFSEVVGR